MEKKEKYIMEDSEYLSVNTKESGFTGNERKQLM